VTEETLAGLELDLDASDLGSPEESGSDIEKVKAEYEDRIKGLQRLVSERDKKIAEREARERQLELAALPEDERISRIQQEYESRLRETQVELELLKLEGQYGSAMPAYRKLIAMDNVEDQLKFLATLAAGAQESSTEPAERPGTVDRNNPRLGADTVITRDGVRMDEAIANRVLGAASKSRRFPW